jgi:hypothetical protein
MLATAIRNLIIAASHREQYSGFCLQERKQREKYPKIEAQTHQQRLGKRG